METAWIIAMAEVIKRDFGSKTPVFWPVIVKSRLQGPVGINFARSMQEGTSLPYPDSFYSYDCIF